MEFLILVHVYRRRDIQQTRIHVKLCLMVGHRLFVLRKRHPNIDSNERARDIREFTHKKCMVSDPFVIRKSCVSLSWSLHWWKIHFTWKCVDSLLTPNSTTVLSSSHKCCENVACFFSRSFNSSCIRPLLISLRFFFNVRPYFEPHSQRIWRVYSNDVFVVFIFYFHPATTYCVICVFDTHSHRLIRSTWALERI